jgi:hypothetical protein
MHALRATGRWRQAHLALLWSQLQAATARRANATAAVLALRRDVEAAHAEVAAASAEATRLSDAATAATAVAGEREAAATAAMQAAQALLLQARV